MFMYELRRLLLLLLLVTHEHMAAQGVIYYVVLRDMYAEVVFVNN
jgi:hypothetical protein